MRKKTASKKIELVLSEAEADLLVECLTCCVRSHVADELWNLRCKLEAARQA
jgi:hypothetical protein